MLDDPSAVERDDTVDVTQRRQPVRNDDRGASFGRTAHVLLDHALALVIERAGRLVENENALRVEQGAGERDSLALAAGQVRAARADSGRVPVGQTCDEIVRARGPGGVDHARHVTLGRAERNVLRHGSPEDRIVLLHRADVAAQPRRIEHHRVHAVEQQAPFGRHVQLLDQAHERALAGAGGSDEADRLAGGDLQRDAVERVAIAARIAEPDILETDGSLELGEPDERTLRALGGRVEDLPHLRHDRPQLGEVVHEHAQPHHRLREPHVEDVDRDELSQRKLPVEHHGCTEPQQPRDREPVHELVVLRHRRPQILGILLRRARIVEAAHQEPLLRVLGMHSLDGVDAVERVEHRLVAVAPRPAGAPPLAPQRRHHHQRRRDIERQAREDDERERRAEVQHQPEEEEHEQDVDEHEHDRVGQEPPQVPQLLDARERLHCGVAQMERHRQIERVADQPRQQRSVDVAHRVAQHLVPRAPQHRLEGEEEQQAADQHVEGGGAPARHHLVDDDEEHQRIDEPEQADDERRGDERAEHRLVAQHVPGDRAQREPFVRRFLRRGGERRLVVTGLHEYGSRNGAGVSGPGLDQVGVVVVHRRHQDEPPVPAPHQHRRPGMAQRLDACGGGLDGQPGAPGAGHDGIEVERALIGKCFAEVFAVDADVALPAQVRQAGKGRRQGGLRVRSRRR